MPFRARGASHRAALALGTMFIALDHDVAGIAPRVPVAPPGVTVGYAAPARLEALPTGFAHASRALQTALAFGEQGAFSLADLSIRPAILADEALGDAFAERHLAPLAGLGMELEDTLRTYLDQGMRIEDTARTLHVHANTLRHRLKRFEETTGTNLRDPRAVVELWWALERRRLSEPDCGPRPQCRQMSTRSTVLIVGEAVLLVVVAVVAVLTSSADDWQPPALVVDPARARAGHRPVRGQPPRPADLRARSWRSCWRWRCSVRRRRRRSASPPCSSITCARATRCRG